MDPSNKVELDSEFLFAQPACVWRSRLHGVGWRGRHGTVGPHGAPGYGRPVPGAIGSKRTSGTTCGSRSPTRENFGLLPVGEQGDEVYFYFAHADQGRDLDGGAGNVRLGEKLPLDA